MGRPYWCDTMHRRLVRPARRRARSAGRAGDRHAPIIRQGSDGAMPRRDRKAAGRRARAALVSAWAPVGPSARAARTAWSAIGAAHSRCGPAVGKRSGWTGASAARRDRAAVGVSSDDTPLAGERPRKLPSRASGHLPHRKCQGARVGAVCGHARACVCICRCSLRVDAQRGELPGECGDIRLQQRVRVDRVHRDAQRNAATDSAPHATDNMQAAHNRMPK
jgi:hypothetical protein